MKRLFLCAIAGSLLSSQMPAQSQEPSSACAYKPGMSFSGKILSIKTDGSPGGRTFGLINENRDFIGFEIPPGIEQKHEEFQRDIDTHAVMRMYWSKEGTVYDPDAKVTIPNLDDARLEIVLPGKTTLCVNTTVAHLRRNVTS